MQNKALILIIEIVVFVAIFSLSFVLVTRTIRKTKQDTQEVLDNNEENKEV